jgi:glycosyltransferase involved in cell wall biosynthesis
MAAAMPIVATAVGQIPSILDHGRTGLLVPAGDPAAFATALESLAADPGLRNRLGTQTRHEAEMRFSWDGVLARITAALPASRKLAYP